MTPWRRQRACAPPWWPADEAWPPVGRATRWRRRRGVVLAIIALLLALLLVLVGIGGTALGALAFGRWPAPLPVRFALPLVAWLVLFILFRFGFVRLGMPVGDIVHAAERIAEGDFSARVAPGGPRFVRTVAAAFNTMAARLEAHDRQRRNLVADIAHELRTPLTIIQGRLEGLLDGVYPRDDARLGDVLEETRVLARLVEDLRTLANAESGILVLQKEPTDLSLLVSDVVNALSGEAAQAGVDVRVDVAADLPAVVLDPLRIRQVVANLLSNALRFTPAGGTVTVAARAAGRAISISVKDTGAGIAAEDLPRIFDRFFKGQTSRGSGLGLTIARDLVAAHGGSVHADSSPGEGTTISFTLPVE